MIDKNESLAKTTKDLLWSNPFFGLFLIGFRKSWSNDVPTACVSKNGINYGLTINEEFWKGLTENWRKGILYHELLHISYFHLERHDEFENHEIRNIAADVSINQDIPEDLLPCKDMSKEDFEKKYEPIMKAIGKDFDDGKITKEEYQKEIHKIPPRGVYLEDFKEMKLKAKEGMRYYYDAFLKESKKKNGNSFLKSLLSNSMCSDDKGPLGHGEWKQFSDLSDSEKKLIKSQLECQLREVVAQVEKSRGVIPGNIKDYLDALDREAPPKFDWRAYLRRFTGGSIKTYTKRTRRKPSKRFEGSPGLRIKYQKHILVGVDTSGSVSDEELKEFFHEIDHMSRSGTDVTVAQFDCGITSVKSYKRSDKIELTGRGGTEFTSICNYYNENQRKYTCLIVATDGEAPAPENTPKGKTLWVLSSKVDKSRSTDHLTGGPTIKLN